MAKDLVHLSWFLVGMFFIQESLYINQYFYTFRMKLEIQYYYEVKIHKI